MKSDSLFSTVEIRTMWQYRVFSRVTLSFNSIVPSGPYEQYLPVDKTEYYLSANLSIQWFSDWWCIVDEIKKLVLKFELK